MPYSQDEEVLLKMIGQNIRKARKNRRLSQEALAFRADLDRTYIGSVERGERNIAVLNLIKLARTLGISVVELFSGVN